MNVTAITPDIFQAVADPNRRSLLDLLLDGPRPVQELGAHFDISLAAISQHLKVLLDAYQPLFAAKADILRRQGRDAAAGEAYLQALELTTNAAERGVLERQVSGMDQVLSGSRAGT
jgi:DNA-binding transcriptional ArsR family regulator